MVAERVVDGLEMVEIDQQQGERSVDKRAVESALQFTLKMRAIGQAGQAIVSRLVCQLEVLPGETIVDGQDALGDLQTEDQLVLAGRLGKEVVGAGAEPLEPVSLAGRVPSTR